MRKLSVAVLLLVSFTMLAQEKPIRPLDVPMSFSGSYGELRHDHFHGGLDWRVGGKTGDPIHSIKSGYIKQVTVSPWGYGNGIYVQHPDSTVSVYGHMSAFTKEIARRIKEEQYEKESFSVSLQFSEDEYPVKQGDIIGYVGNTGSSAGPHLHMELRDSANVPLNYISMGYYSPTDKLCPTFRRVAFYALDTLPVPRPFRVNMITNPQAFTNTISLPAVSYVAMDAVDLEDGTTGKLAVEEYNVYLDGERIFHFKIGNVGFDEGRHIKSLIQRGERGADMIKTVVDPANMLASKIDTLSGGQIRLADYNLHNLKLEALDEHGNCATVKFKVKRSDNFAQPASDTTYNTSYFFWYQPNSIEADEMTFSLPAGSLYDNARVEWKRVSEADPACGYYSPVWQVVGGDAPLQGSALLKLSHQVPEEKLGKAYISAPGFGYVGPLDGARVGWGTFFVTIDEEGPAITTDKAGNIRVKDAKSGVSSVRLLIDGKWHLSMFKRGIVQILDKESIKKGQRKVTVEAVDNMGNTTTYEKIKQF